MALKSHAVHHALRGAVCHMGWLCGTPYWPISGSDVYQLWSGAPHSELPAATLSFPWHPQATLLQGTASIAQQCNNPQPPPPQTPTTNPPGRQRAVVACPLSGGWGQRPGQRWVGTAGQEFGRPNAPPKVQARTTQSGQVGVDPSPWFANFQEKSPPPSPADAHLKFQKIR